MSQEHVDLLRLLEDRTNRGQMSQMSDMEIRSFFHPDVEFLPLRAATEGAYHGIAGIERFIADNEAVFEKFEPHQEFLDLDERVLTWGTIRVKAKQSGIDTDIPVGGVVEFRDGKIVRSQAFDSKEKALKAVGLAE
jgi:SnoaL-like protein